MSVAAYLKGIATFIPGFYPQLVELIQPGRTGGTDSARYCYSVWLRHLVMASRSGLPTHPKAVAELGPGDSLGAGIAALLSGADTYYGFDVFQYASNERNLKILDELLDLFHDRAPIPSEEEFPEVQPRLRSYEFPARILTNARLSKALAKTRVASIRRALQNLKARAFDGIQVCYRVPWHGTDVIHRHSVDMVFSQAVLEHVDDLQRTYWALFQWLKPTGYMSHTIDFRSHGRAKEWNGHWSYSDLEWKVLSGRRPWLLNRQPHSTHRKLAEQNGFKFVSDMRQQGTGGLDRKQLARSFRGISDEDLSTSGAFVQAVPRAG
jgi:hypothetical protein